VLHEVNLRFDVTLVILSNLPPVRKHAERPSASANLYRLSEPPSEPRTPGLAVG